MASSEFLSPEEVQKQIKAISEAAATYDPGKAAHDFVGRTKIISQARELIDSLTDPDDLPLVHIGQVCLRAHYAEGNVLTVVSTRQWIWWRSGV